MLHGPKNISNLKKKKKTITTSPPPRPKKKKKANKQTNKFIEWVFGRLLIFFLQKLIFCTYTQIHLKMCEFLFTFIETFRWTSSDLAARTFLRIFCRYFDEVLKISFSVWQLFIEYLFLWRTPLNDCFLHFKCKDLEFKLLVFARKVRDCLWFPLKIYVIDDHFLEFFSNFDQAFPPGGVNIYQTSNKNVRIHSI